MDPKRVSTHFVAAIGLDRLLNRMAEIYLQIILKGLISEYRKEAQYERARLMRQNPLDYRAVRQMDHELEDVRRRLQHMEFEQAYYQ